MSLGQALVILGAGVAAGAINAAVGSGTLITFPALLAFGYPAVTANVSSTVGLVPGYASGVHGYRRELGAPTAPLRALSVVSALGGLGGALLLLVLPASVFRDVVPAFIGAAVVLVAAQPLIARRRQRVAGRANPHVAPLLAGVLLVSVYGGYFGAAQGVLLIGLLALAVRDDLQRINALKNLLSALVNVVAAVVFVVAAHVAWDAAGLIAAGSIAGAQIGARTGRRLPAPALRALVVAVGLVAMIKLLA